mmetsp:Transcript_24027/g.36967  ORF Transcript_24027/g.36967 Transcript_24027/m.36967 type:complete len:262 (-) Transcript_24027:1110-1895(-)
MVLTSSLLSVFPIVAGMAFLEKAPPKFRCKQFSAERMDNVLMNHQMSWKSCNREEICAEALPKSDYQPIKTESEYLDNWVEKLDLLCRPDHEIGLLGSCFFIGVIISILWVPKTSDQIGRYKLVLLTFSAQMLAQIGLFLTHRLEIAFFLMVIIGMTLPGKNIVCFNLVLESCPLSLKQTVVNLVMIAETFYIIIIAFYYQFISKNWMYLQGWGLLQISVSLIFAALYFKESPKFLMNKGRYDEARATMRHIAKFNGIQDF